MPDFSKRSYEKELLDRDDIPFADIKITMQELDTVNARLGGHATTLAGIRSFIPGKGSDEVVHICEIGCGGGNNLRVVKKWCEKNNIKATYTGIDINEHAIAYARELQENRDIVFICSDYRKAEFNHKPDIIFSSLFCHHFTNEQLTEMFHWSYKNSSRGFFINDLHRHPMAFYSIKTLTQIFSNSYLVKHDASLSVLRGFSKSELNELLQSAGIERFSIAWRWAFRWLVIVKK